MHGDLSSHERDHVLREISHHVQQFSTLPDRDTYAIHFIPLVDAEHEQTMEHACIVQVGNTNDNTKVPCDVGVCILLIVSATHYVLMCMCVM